MPDKTNALMSASEISEKTTLPVPTVAKVLKLLAKGEVIDSVRGANGGYKLARKQREISVYDIVTAVDGPICLTSCVDNIGVACEYTNCCVIKGRWDQVNNVIKDALGNMSLSDMVKV